jgi:hypothetical protein
MHARQAVIVASVWLAACGSATPRSEVSEGSVASAGSGPATVSDEAEPTAARADPRRRFVAVHAGNEAYCALDDRGEVLCWGTGHGLTPHVVRTGATDLLGVLWTEVCTVEGGALVSCGAAPAGTVALAAPYGNEGCALAGGEVWCWARDHAPTRVEGVTGGVEITGGGGLSCVRDAAGLVWCWGRGVASATPIAVSFPAAVVSMAAGDAHACAALADGRVACWGARTRGGASSDGAMRAATEVTIMPGLTDAAFVAASSSTTCAVSRAGDVDCWGTAMIVDDRACETRGHDDVPRRIEGLTDVRALALGSLNGCAVREDGDVTCFGRGLHGESGDGSTWSSSRSTRLRTIAVASADEERACISGAERATGWPHHVALTRDGSTAGFCISGCLRVDLASGAFSSGPPIEDPMPEALEPTVELDVVVEGRRVSACTSDEPRRCTPLGRGNPESAAAILVEQVVVYAQLLEQDEEAGGQFWRIAGHSAATGELLYEEHVSTEAPLVPRAVGPWVLSVEGRGPALRDARTGAVVQQLRNLTGEVTVFRLGGGRWAITDATGSHVEIVSESPAGTRVVEVGSRFGAAVVTADEHLAVFVRSHTANASEYEAAVVGDVVVVDLDTGMVRASYTPPLCEVVPPPDPCVLDSTW